MSAGLLDATEPPEARGLARDEVRLMIASPDRLVHSRFRSFASFLSPGDLLVVNTSATLAAALDCRREDGSAVVVHVSTSYDDDTCVVELRSPGAAKGPVTDARAGERIDLPGGGQLVLLQHHLGSHRLWRASSELHLTDVLARHGRPITYSYVQGRWPLASYQTVFGVDPGSAEMASAARPFSPQVVTDLATRGITVAPVLLHTGVSSPEVGEPPQPERFAVSAATAALVRHTRAQGGRVVAVGTTVTRALETAADLRGQVWPGHGWTDLVLGRTRPARVVTGLVTGWHPPGASHLQLLEAVAGPDLVRTAYAAAAGYRWHEFGDSCLLLA